MSKEVSIINSVSQLSFLLTQNGENLLQWITQAERMGPGSLVLIPKMSSGLCMMENTLCWHPSGLKYIFSGGIFTITLAVW